MEFRQRSGSECVSDVGQKVSCNARSEGMPPVQAPQSPAREPIVSWISNDARFDGIQDVIDEATPYRVSTYQENALEPIGPYGAAPDFPLFAGLVEPDRELLLQIVHEATQVPQHQ